MATIVDALQALATRVDALSARVDSNGERAPSHAIDALHSALAARTAQSEALATVVDAHAAQLAGMATRIGALEDVVKAQRGTIAGLLQQLEHLRSALGDVDRLEARMAPPRRTEAPDPAPGPLDEPVRNAAPQPVEA
jgi:hypothetical protein